MARNSVEIIVEAVDDASRILKSLERDIREIQRAVQQTPDFDVDTRRAVHNVRELRREIRYLPERKNISINVDVDAAKVAIASLIATLPALVPIAASLVAAVGALAPAFAAAGVAVTGFAAVAMTALDESNKKAQTALQDFQKYWESFAGSFEPQVTNMFVAFLNDAKKVLDALKPTISAALDAIGELQAGFSAFTESETFKEFMDWLATQAKPAILAFGQAFGNIMAGIMELLMAFTPLIPDMEQGLVSLTEKFRQWAASLQESEGFQNFINYVKENGPVVMEFLGQLSEAIGQLIVALAPLGADILKGIVDFINWFKQMIAEMNVGKEQVTAIWNTIKGVISGALTIIKGIIKIVMSAILGDWKGAWEGVKLALKGAWQIIKTILTSGVKAAIEIIKGLLKAIGAFASDLYEAGKDMIMGLIDGIKSMAKRVVDTAVKVAKDAVAAVKRWLGIKSPSRLMAEIGRNIGEGLVLGMNQMVPKVVEAAGNMSEAVAQQPEIEAGAANTGARGATGIIRQPIQINLVLDRGQLMAVVREELTIDLNRAYGGVG